MSATLAPASLPALIQRILARTALHRSRQRLTRLDDHILRDIGLTRAQAQEEAARSLWDAPAHWRD